MARKTIKTETWDRAKLTKLFPSCFQKEDKGMNKKCACGSYAINQTSHGREIGVDSDLCDVCYWKKRAEIMKSICDEWFLSPMVRPYAGANEECLFCGATMGKNGNAHHSAADCPHLKYLDIVTSSR